MSTQVHSTLGIVFLWFTPQKVATRSSHPCPQPKRVQVRPVVSSGNFLGPGGVDPTKEQRTRPTCNTKNEAADEAKRGVAVWSAVGFGTDRRLGPCRADDAMSFLCVDEETFHLVDLNRMQLWKPLGRISFQIYQIQAQPKFEHFNVKIKNIFSPQTSWKC